MFGVVSCKDTFKALLGKILLSLQHIAAQLQRRLPVVTLKIGAMDMVGEECVGFLFDGELPKARKTIEICGRSIHFLSIDDDPGHVQVKCVLSSQQCNVQCITGACNGLC